MGGGDERPFAGNEPPLDGVLELADVSRPRVPPQQLEGVPTQRDIGLAHLDREGPNEGVGPALFIARWKKKTSLGSSSTRRMGVVIMCQPFVSRNPEVMAVCPAARGSE